MTTSKIDIHDVNLITLTVQEKTDLLVRLIDEHPINALKTPGGKIFVGLSGTVFGKSRGTIVRRIPTHVYAPRLYILEAFCGRVTRTTEVKRFSWWKSKIKSVTEDTRTDYDFVPRAAWDVEAIFIGSDNAMTDIGEHAITGGDAFGDGPGIPLPDMPAAIDLTITVRNSLSFHAPFRAVVVGGTEPPSRKPSEDDVRLTRDEADRLAKYLSTCASLPGIAPIYAKLKAGSR